MNLPPSLQTGLHKTRDSSEKIAANAREAEKRSFLPNHIELASAAGALVTARRESSSFLGINAGALQRICDFLCCGWYRASFTTDIPNCRLMRKS